MPRELYHVDEDFSQAPDLAQKHPENLAEPVKLFFAEAARDEVLPLDDRKTARLDVADRPSANRGELRPPAAMSRKDVTGDWKLPPGARSIHAAAGCPVGCRDFPRRHGGVAGTLPADCPVAGHCGCVSRFVATDSARRTHACIVF